MSHVEPLQYPPVGTSGVKEHSTSPMIKTQMVLPVRELPHFEGMKREDVITFIWSVDEIAQGACWTDKEWVFTMADLLGGHAAPLARWIRTGLSVGQPIGWGFHFFRQWHCSFFRRHASGLLHFKNDIPLKTAQIRRTARGFLPQ